MIVAMLIRAYNPNITLFVLTTLLSLLTYGTGQKKQAVSTIDPTICGRRPWRHWIRTTLGLGLAFATG